MSDALARGLLWLGYRLLIGWAFVRRPHVYGAHVYVQRATPADPGTQVLVIRNSYKAGVTVPCGGIKRRETPREAAARELAEEVGIRVDPDALVEETVITVTEMWRTDHAHFFRLELGSGEEVVPQIDRREVIWAEFVDEATLQDLDLVPHLRSYLAWRREHADRAPRPYAG